MLIERKSRKINKAHELLSSRTRRVVTSALAIFVVSLTVALLMLPAITMNRAYCGLEEHVHDENCYAPCTAYSCDEVNYSYHDPSCYDGAGNLICGYEAHIIHTHDDFCFDENGELICPLAEVAIHIHDENCYSLRSMGAVAVSYQTTETAPAMGALAESEPAIGALAESEPAIGALAESEPAIGALAETAPAIGALAESEPAMGAPAESEPAIGAPVESEPVQDETDGLVETEISAETGPVLSCELREIIPHTHTDACLVADGNVVCGHIEWIVHQHTEDCLGSGQSDVLICEIAEHEHTDACRTNLTAEELIPFIDELPGFGEIEEELLCLNEEEQLSFMNSLTFNILRAFAAYDQLPSDQQQYIDNYDRLSDYAYYITEDLDAKIVIGEIAKLPYLDVFEEEYVALSATQKPAYTEMLLESISGLQTLYGRLSEEQQALVRNYDRMASLENSLRAVYTGEELLSYAADGYTTTVFAPQESLLPSNTVITAAPVYDSDYAMVSAFTFSGSAEETEDDAVDYADEIMQTITWGEVTRIRLFDITLSADNREVQPAVPVDVRTEFDEPMYISEDEVVYGVHFGEDGVEILPTTTERDAYGNVIAITHTQSGFSPTGYVLVHISNPKDIGPDILPVHYCIWANNQWVIVGSSRTGWYGNYDFREEWPPTDDQCDYITVDQMYSVLADYGLILKEEPKGTLALSAENIQTLSKTIWYQRAEDDPINGTTVRHDTTPEQKDVDGNGTLEWIFPLSANRIKDDGYHIYYVPGGTISGKEIAPSTTYDNNEQLGEDLTESSKFYSVEVHDMNGIVYDGSTSERQQNQIPALQYIKYGSMTFVNVLPNGENGWQWINGKGELVWTMAEKDDSTASFYYEEAGKNGKETYGVLNIQERMTLIPYSKAVQKAQTNKEHMVDIMVHLDGEWQNVGHISVLYQKDDLCDGRWFITAGQLYTYLKDFGFTVNSYAPDDVMNQFHKFTYAYGRADLLSTQDMIMYVCDKNDVVSHDDGTNNTVAVGLGTEADTVPKDYTIFYIPGSDDEDFAEVDKHGAKAYAASEKIVGDRFYSIKVVDDYQLVYYGHETDNFLVYVQEGQPTSVSVQNALSVLWSVREPWHTERPEQYVKTEFTTDYDNNFNTFNFTAVNGPLRIEASSLNPSYYVQYFANIERYRLYGENESRPANSVPLIDTSTGSKLPQNGTTPPLKYLGLTGTSSEYHVDTYIDNAEIYTQTKYVYDKANNWDNIDKLYDNNHYIIQEIRILKDGRDPLSTDDNDFWIYKVDDAHDNIKFTNRASEEYAPRDEANNVQSGKNYTILITEGMVMRLFYTLSETDSTNSNVAFYDYDISSNGTNTLRQGINSIHGSNAGSTYAGYAFGNNNAGSGTADYRWKGNALNIYNHAGNGYSGCTFGLVQGINSDGTLRFSSGITAPTIFAGTKPTGRTDYTGSLTFHRKGDVYTLSASSIISGNKTSTGANLDRFFNPTSAGGTLYPTIYTNNFWALDGLPGEDGLGGGPGEDHTWIPDSDDGKNHNSYFGMNFAVEFSLTSDYIGPTEYIFFGDDDMWVFLSSDTNGDGAYDMTELICDIGGVHSSVGEYVNLRDYIPEGSAGRYRLDFYYVERGASGSTCWMSYTLPSVTYTTVEKGTSEIVISKKLQDANDDEIVSDERYEFTLQLFTDKTKTTPINTSFSEEIHRADGLVEYRSFESGQKIHLASGDSVRVLGLPIDTWYVITEVADIRFNVEANGNALTATAEGWVVEGTTEADVMRADYVNILKGGPVLPNTGGGGKLPYIFSGWAMIAVASILIYKTKRKNGRRQNM